MIHSNEPIGYITGAKNWTSNSRASVRRILLIVIILTVVAAAGFGMLQRGVGEVEMVDAGARFGKVRLYVPEEASNSVLMLFSGTDGWDSGLDEAARHLADRDVLVVGIDVRPVLVHAAEGSDECIYLVSDIEKLSQEVQRRLKRRTYVTPILAGVGAGGTLAYASLAQAPIATIEGAVSIDPTRELATSRPFCAGAPAIPLQAGDGYSYGRFDGLPGWWRLALHKNQPNPFPWAEQVEAAEIMALHKKLKMPDAVVAAVGEAVDEAAAPDDSTLADLPITEVPSTGDGPFMAIVLSGDGGWRDIDKDIAGWLAQNDVPAIGLDSLRYFWTKKSPDDIARDLERIVARYGPLWHRSKIILVGYSFGAGVLPATYNHLADDVKRNVILVSLLAVEPRADFQFHVAGWVGSASAEAEPVAGEAAKLPPEIVQCFYGKEEEKEETLCRDPVMERTERIATEGGHHFDGDYDRLARMILEGAEKRLTQS